MLKNVRLEDEDKIMYIRLAVRMGYLLLLLATTNS